MPDPIEVSALDALSQSDVEGADGDLSAFSLIVDEDVGGGGNSFATAKVEVRELFRALGKSVALWGARDAVDLLFDPEELSVVVGEPSAPETADAIVTLADLVRERIAHDVIKRPVRSLTPTGAGVTAELAQAVAVQTTVGTLTARAIAGGGTWVERQLRNAIVTAASPNAQGHRALVQSQIVPEAGFDFTISIALVSGGAGHRFFAGLASSAATLYTGATDPSSLVNIIGVGIDAADSRVRVMHNDGAGAATVIDPGGGAFGRTGGLPLRLRLVGRMVSGSLVVHYEVTRLDSGLYVSGELLSDLPSETQLLVPVWQVSATAGGTAGELDFFGLAFQSRME